jgi:hypothetical protein
MFVQKLIGYTYSKLSDKIHDLIRKIINYLIYIQSDRLVSEGITSNFIRYLKNSHYILF